MKTWVLLTILSLIAAESLTQREIILQKFKDSNAEELFKVYHTVFKKNYKLDSPEGLKRYSNFEKSLKRIRQMNAELGNEVYGLTQYTDMSEEEYKTDNSADIEVEPQVVTENTFLESYSGEINWKHLFGPVKNQGYCGSCWSFASAAAIEANYKLKFGETKVYSEQYLVECNTKANGCKGGSSTTNLQWIMENGMVPAHILPYREQAFFCHSSMRDSAEHVLESIDYCESNCDPNKWRSLLAQGPIIVTIDGENFYFKNFKPGQNGSPIYNPPSCGKPNHAVVAIGLRVYNGEEYILFRNSHGADWGVGGYFEMPVKNNCFAMISGWLPKVRKATPLKGQQGCPRMILNQCDQTTQSISVCSGISNAPGKIVGYEGTPINRIWTFFEHPNCKGRTNFSYDTNKCFANSKFSMSEVKQFSSALGDVSNKKGCFTVTEKPCGDGAKVMICSDVSDIKQWGLNFNNIGSLFLGKTNEWGHILSIVLFENPNFTGPAYGIPQGTIENLENNPEIVRAFARAKSIGLILIP
jgi:C1A family cysteine protease